MLFCAMSGIQRHAVTSIATITEFADDPNDLQTDIADPRGITATATIVDRRQCQQAMRLLRVLRSPCQSP
jgi:hypothetical protein